MVSEKAPRLVQISWCPNCNVPVLNEGPCKNCSSETRRIPVNSSRLKPVFSEEKRFYNQIIDKSLSTSDDLLPSDECFISCGSVVVDGQKAFRISFTEGEWKAKAFAKYVVGDLVGSNLEEVLRANEHLLKEKEAEAVSFLENTFDQYDLPAVVSMSGGKDSVVALSLALKVDNKIPVVYMNTTLDFPETVDYIHRLSREWKLDLNEILPEKNFFDLAKELGPPSSMMPWCCQTQKFAPFNKYLNANYPKGILSIEGLRRFESGKRMNYKRISQNRAIPRKKSVCPILNWTSLDVWLYILWKKIPFNPVYEFGYDRIGCWACPHKGMPSFRMMEHTHPRLLGNWNEFLLSYASSNGKDKEWVLNGKWRLRHEPYEKV
ncbi:MAG: phosphoadenosine phosphosulfate reductase family protein, partial [Candidatus Bathyarchaeota archaeon]|nr:phosphoadenosine phosphosulfate reductase family protein [Candidatus Bathyarchaeota archaeon]